MKLTRKKNMMWFRYYAIERSTGYLLPQKVALSWR